MKKLLISLLFMMIAISSFGQLETTTIVKEDFPKIYSVIVRESVAEFPSNYSAQRTNIDVECYAFSLYFLLIYIDSPSIPKNVLSNIQIKATKKYSKNFNIGTICDDISDDIEKIDCTLSHMVIDWFDVISEINTQIESYKIINEIN
jgi:hypothetical protein